MKQIEIYTYDRKELVENLVITNKENKNNIEYITEKSLCNVYLPNSKIVYAKLSYINNLILSNAFSTNTSVGTFVSDSGSIVFNFNYVVKFGDSRPSDNEILEAKPTFVSGEYSKYSNIKIIVQVIKNSGERILVIEHD